MQHFRDLVCMRPPGRWTTWYVGHLRERHPSIRLGTKFGCGCSMGQWDEWVDPNFAFQRTDPIVVGLVLIYTICKPPLAREGWEEADEVTAGFMFFSLAPLLYRTASSSYFNMSLLTSDFYGLVFGTSSRLPLDGDTDHGRTRSLPLCTYLV